MLGIGSGREHRSIRFGQTDIGRVMMLEVHAMPRQPVKRRRVGLGDEILRMASQTITTTCRLRFAAETSMVTPDSSAAKMSGRKNDRGGAAKKSRRAGAPGECAESEYVIIETVVRCCLMDSCGAKDFGLGPGWPRGGAATRKQPTGGNRGNGEWLLDFHRFASCFRRRHPMTLRVHQVWRLAIWFPASVLPFPPVG